MGVENYDPKRYAPFVLLAFGAGWLVGADAPWYWGAIVMGIAAYWHTKRNKEKGVGN